MSFRWKDEARGADMQLGVIAQGVESVFPELVFTDGEGYKLVVPLIEAVKTLKTENDALKSAQ